MRAALVEAGLVTALRSRDVIGQAKGLSMARYRLTDDLAFELLERHSQNRNKKLASLAEEIARTGDAPAPPK